MCNKEAPMTTRVVRLFNKEENLGIFGSSNYVIPIYQRSYSWQEEQIEDFLNSIKECYENKQFVFMGTVQFMLSSSECNKIVYDVIDGQQRMTTFILFCKILELICGEDIVKKYKMSLKIKNFSMNESKLEDILSYKLSDIPQYCGRNKTKLKSFLEETKDNIYLRNMSMLMYFYNSIFYDLKQEDEKGFCKNLFESIKNNIYFVELITNGISLPQVVSIFNTINTTGMELNSTDLFKLSYYEYLKKNENATEEWMEKITECYDYLDANSIQMQGVLNVYKHCIVAEYNLKWENLSLGNDKFFTYLFEGKIGNLNSMKDMLKYSEFKRLVQIYVKFRNDVITKPNEMSPNIGQMEMLSIELIETTRYKRYSTIPYVALFFLDRNKAITLTKRYEIALSIALEVYKLLAVNSINYLRVINPIQSYISGEILPLISKLETNDIEYSIIKNIQIKVKKSPYDDLETSEETFVNRISSNLFDNGKNTYIVCVLSGILYEKNKNNKVENIRKHFFDWDKNPFDLEHIYAQNKFKNESDEDKSMFNSIGNIMVLERNINREIKDIEVNKKIVAYKSSKFYEVKGFVKIMEKNNSIWTIEEVKKRLKEQKVLLCDFLFNNK